MADVMAAFLQGHQYGQAEQEHGQLLEQNKLRTMVLKHEIDRMKIDDQVRARELAQNNFTMMNGQPAADIPSTNVTTAQPNLPSTGLAGMVNGLVRDRGPLVANPQEAFSTEPNGRGAPLVANAPTPGTDPTFTPAPAAQAAQPQTHDVTTRVANAINVPGVPGLGVPGVSLRPRSLEEHTRAAIAAELAKVLKLGPGERASIPALGSEPIATGGAQLRSVGAGGLAEVNPDGTVKQIAPGRGGAVTRPVAGILNGHPEFGTPQADGSFLVKGQPAPNFQPRPNDAAIDRKLRAKDAQDRFEYSSYVAGERRKHADAMKAWTDDQKKVQRAPDGTVLSQGSGDPDAEMPTYDQPTFEEWLGARDSKKAGASATSGTGGKGKAAQLGEQRIINGVLAEWKTIDGKSGWAPVGGGK